MKIEFSKKWVIGVIILFLVIGGYVIFHPKPIKVAVVHMPDFMMARMAKSIDENNVSLSRVEQLSKLKNYDAVVVFGMGLNWSKAQRDSLEALNEKGVKYMVMMAPNPDNNLSNIDSSQLVNLVEYFGYGGTRNYRSGFNYLRREVLGKSLREGKVEKPIAYPDDALFTKADEDKAFTSVAEYQKYYDQHGFKPDAPKIALLTGVAGPFNGSREYLDELIGKLESSGFNVYPVASFMQRIKFLSDINPDLVIYLAHGRLAMGQGDLAVKWLEKYNIPLICPLLINQDISDWMKDPKGMSGGFMSQTIVTPELDGAIEPYALVGLETQPDGIKLFKTIPGRLQTFVNLCKNYVKLKKTANKDKRIAIYYYKGPGQNSLVAQGLEVVPSLYNLLKDLKANGYTVDNLPVSESEFYHLLMSNGAIFNGYAKGSQERFLQTSHPAFVSISQLNQWLKNTIEPAMIDTLEAHYGKAPGRYMTLAQNDQKGIAVTRIQFGNIVLLPQPAQGVGENDFKMIHGSVPVPAYPFIVSYLWVRNGFKADALMHFGTHGSFEFIQGKQVALSSYDWSDRLVNDLPHIYYYTTANVGEAMIAKRRSYAQIVSYINVPFMSSGLAGPLKSLIAMMDKYLANEEDDIHLSLEIKKIAVKNGYNKDLKLDDNLSTPYSREDIEELADFVEELAQAKIPGGMYTTGVPFSREKVNSSVMMLSIDPIAYGLASIDKMRGKVTDEKLKHDWFFARYQAKAKKIAHKYLNQPPMDMDIALKSFGVTTEELAATKRWNEHLAKKEAARKKMLAMMLGDGASLSKGMMGGKAKAPKKRMTLMDMMKAAAQGKKMPSKEELARRRAIEEKEEKKSKDDAPSGMMGMMGGEEVLTPQEEQDKKVASAVNMLSDAVKKCSHYREAIINSPKAELTSVINALNGGYTAPSPGGDFVASPDVLPSGRNLFAIDAERTPTASAWDQGKQLGDELLKDYARNHKDEIPRKVSFTLWSSSFIESRGTTIAEILYLLGVEPVRDRMGRVLDVRLIPIKELGRPRIDVMIQTSGQFRDMAASRLFLIQKAIAMAAKADNEDPKLNYVAVGVKSAERLLLDQGVPPAEARALSTARIFGGLNGAFGTGIRPMVEAGDKWEKRKEIADVYAHNMGAIYGSDRDWGKYVKGAFEAAIQNTDAVVQPRQSNTWGVLSLDHVYEFMGGLTLTVREKTGKDPDGFINDLRNRRRAKTQGLKQSIGVEAKTTILNPTYVREQLKEGAGAANAIDETIRNTYAWNVMKPAAIDKELWQGIYDMYIEDKAGLGVKEFFEKVNPAALQDYTATMLETIRKGMWRATSEQIKKIADLHVKSIEVAGAGCSQMVCNNMKLQNFIGAQLSGAEKSSYMDKINNVRNNESANSQNAKNNAKVLKKEEDNSSKKGEASASGPTNSGRMRQIGLVLGAILIIALVVILLRRRKHNDVDNDDDDNE